jgi:hypothetical protein
MEVLLYCSRINFKKSRINGILLKLSDLCIGGGQEAATIVELDK